LTENVSLRELITHILNEVKAALTEYAQKQEGAVKRRLKRLIIYSITSAVLMSIGISMAGSASLFFLIGSLRYLQTFMPAWQAWFVVAAGSAVTAAALFIALYFVIRSQLRAPETPAESS